VATADKSVLFQKLPSTDDLLRLPEIKALIENDGHAAVAESIRVVLTRLRQEIANGRIAGADLNEKSLDLALGGLSAAIERQLRQSLRYSLLPVINAAGVILHTNLGRAPLAGEALDHIRATATVIPISNSISRRANAASAMFMWIDCFASC
jgi:L-seryl-tRNA(Ser) seleniumtransferase